jgi:hypothetical protein
MLQYLDAQSRWHLRTFASQVAFLALIGLPVLLIDRHVPALYLLQLRTMFGFSALIMLVLGVASRQALSRASLCVWDHFLAFLLLKVGCSLALWMLG